MQIESITKKLSQWLQGFEFIAQTFKTLSSLPICVLMGVNGWRIYPMALAIWFVCNSCGLEIVNFLKRFLRWEFIILGNIQSWGLWKTRRASWKPLQIEISQKLYFNDYNAYNTCPRIGNLSSLMILALVMNNWRKYPMCSNPC